MTGLNAETDALIEVAVVITDAQLNVVAPGIDVLIAPEHGALDRMNDFVRQMHTASGLLEDLEAGVTMEQACDTVLAYVKKYVPGANKALLAGNSIGTDKRFLEVNMPLLIDHLHYRVVDVSTLKELAKRWHPVAYECAPTKQGGHRALADILESIQELAYYRRVLFPPVSLVRDDVIRIRDEVMAQYAPILSTAASQ
ncbi:oligoribonuclease [Schaalia suimastitidis]|uniref:oligoribonuclease n=1 Tax=Schaalia suimastitidis TaxID=121163 RepID=UPI00068493F7